MEGGRGTDRFPRGVHPAFGLGYFIGVRGRPRVAGLSSASKLWCWSPYARAVLLFRPRRSLPANGSRIPWQRRGTSAAYTEQSATTRNGHAVRDLCPADGAGAASGAGPAARRVLLAPALTLARALFVVSVVGTVAFFIAMGANAGAAHWALFPWFVLAGHWPASSGSTPRSGSHCSPRVCTVVFCGCLHRVDGPALIGGVSRVCSARQRSPRQPTAYTWDMEAMRPHGSLADRSGVRIGWDGLAFYLSQGYFATYLSLQEPFVPCYGVGISLFLQRQVARLTGNPRLGECATRCVSRRVAFTRPDIGRRSIHGSHPT